MCWISDQASVQWRIIGGKGVEWFSWIFVVACYASTIRHVRTLAPLMTEAQRYPLSAIPLCIYPFLRCSHMLM
jgi:hypothetical protein